MIYLRAALLVLVATVFEVGGDALIRKCIYEYTGTARVSFFLIGAVCLFVYGYAINSAPLEFGQIVGLYIATLFVVWQVGNYLAFKTLPTVPVAVGGALIIAGGLLVSFWKPS